MHRQALLVSILLVATQLVAAEERYELGPDSRPREGVPQGTVTKGVFESPEVFPGTIREYHVYVPKQYDGSRPAAVMVFQDGHTYVNSEGEFRVPTVFDSLIAEGAMPVTIGVFVNPGHARSALPNDPWRASNRSFEHDTPSDAYARFLLDELLPHIAEERELKLTDDPEQRAIGGISSGGICAWTVAWERPDAFRKVLSHVGSFTNIRGGHVYPSLIRKTEPKPIRVFLQDGENDLNNQHGSWWLANLQMDSALEFAGYDYEFAPGKGAHNGNHGGAILPDSLRWLWRDGDSRH